MTLLATAAFFACAFRSHFVWFFGWRLASGISGGALMILAAPTVLPHVPQHRRGLASGAIFAGIGVGIVVSGTLVPLLLRQGLTQAWVGLGVIALILTVIAWPGWPSAALAPVSHPYPGKAVQPVTRLRMLYAEYALAALGLVPHMIFLVDFIARGLGQGLDAGAQYWVFSALALWLDLS